MQQVIYAWNYLEWGGAQIHILALIKEVRKEFDVLVLLPSGSDPQFIKYLDELGVNYDLFDGHIDLSPATSLRQRLRRRISKFKSEHAMLNRIAGNDLRHALVHVDLLPHQSLASLIWLCLKTKVFITSHNRLPPVAVWRELLWKVRCRIISGFPNFHVFCSNIDAKEYFAAQYSPKLAKRIEVTYTSVNPEEIVEATGSGFDRDAVRASLGIPKNAFTALCVGNFIDRKGRWTFLRAAQRVSKTDPSIRFVWLSPSSPSAADHERIAEFGLGEAFRIVVSDTVGSERLDILRFFRIADAFALPSFVEGLPIALLEAMALGLPSISSNVNAIPEAVKDGETGILIDAGDSDALAAAILKLSADDRLRQRLAENGRGFVLEHFDERAVAKKVIRIYKESLRDG
jgi:glycosyltransferase involved in cell wall biosynthesis